MGRLVLLALDNSKAGRAKTGFERGLKKVSIRTSICQGDRDMDQLDRITRNPAVMGGKACIRGMRVTVGMIVGQIGSGRSIDELLADYPYLEREDVMQALRYSES